MASTASAGVAPFVLRDPLLEVVACYLHYGVNPIHFSMKDSIDSNKPESGRTEGGRNPVPPYNDELDPDNAVSPNDLEEREEEGERKFYPEGGPEDPPVEFPRGFPKD